MKFDSALQGVNGLAIVALFHPGFALDIEGAGAFGIEKQGLRGFDERIIREIGIESGDGKSHMGFRSVFPSQ